MKLSLKKDKIHVFKKKHTVFQKGCDIEWGTVSTPPPQFERHDLLKPPLFGHI